MRHLLGRSLSLVLPTLVAAAGAAWSHPAAAPGERLEDARPLAAHVPERALVLVEGPGLSEVFERGLAHPAVAAVLGSELGRTISRGAGTSAIEAHLSAAGEALGTPLLPALADLTRRGAALALAPPAGGEDRPDWLLALRGDDAERVEGVLTALLEHAGAKAGFPRAFDRPHQAIDGADVWYAGVELALARRGALVLLSNDKAFLHEALALESAGGRGSLADVEAWRRASDGYRDGDLLRAWLRVDAMREAHAAHGDHRGRGFEKLLAAHHSPAAHYLLGPGLASIGTADELSLALRASERGLSVEVRGRGVDTPEAVSPRGVGDGFAVPSSIAHSGLATAVLYRDLAGLFARRAELYPAEDGPALVRGLAHAELFFGGVDVAEDVLPALSPWLRLVSAPVSYGDGLAPEIPLPAVAVLVDVRDDEVGPRLVSAFQSLIGVIGVDRAQKGGDPLTLHLALEGETEVCWASFPKPKPGDGVDVRYNLAPACALVGRTFVLGTHVELVRRTVADLSAGRVLTVSGVSERVELASAPIASLLEANLEALAMQAVLKEGKTLEKARADVRGIALLLRVFDGARFEVVYPSPGELRLELDLRLAR